MNQMNQIMQSLKHFFRQMPPFILLGISIAFIIGIFIVFSYVLLWGLLIGAVLWGVNAIVRYFRSPSSDNTSSKPPHSSSKGRIIDHDKN